MLCQEPNKCVLQQLGSSLSTCDVCPCDSGAGGGRGEIFLRSVKIRRRSVYNLTVGQNILGGIPTGTVNNSFMIISLKGGQPKCLVL